MLRAAQKILDRLHGKAKQEVEHARQVSMTAVGTTLKRKYERFAPKLSKSLRAYGEERQGRAGAAPALTDKLRRMCAPWLRVRPRPAARRTGNFPTLHGSHAQALSGLRAERADAVLVTLSAPQLRATGEVHFLAAHVEQCCGRSLPIR